MKSIFFTLLLLSVIIACETPQNIKQSPDNTTNTSGTTGSATMTEKTPAVESGSTPAAGKDTLGVVKDSLTK